MRSKIILIPAFLFLFSCSSFAGIIVNYDGLGYEEALSNALNISNLRVSAVIIGSPFKGYELKKSGTAVYDYFDTGVIFERGAFQNAMGSPLSFSNLINYFHGRNTLVYSMVSLFIQKQGYDRKMWDSSDFTEDSYTFGPTYYLNTAKENTREKLTRIIKYMSALPVDKWIIDLRGMPENLAAGYNIFLRQRGGGRFISLTDQTNADDGSMCTGDYYFLREKIFIMPDPHLKELKTFALHPGWIQFIDSSSPSVNNYAALSFLLSRGKDVVIPYGFLNSYGGQVIAFFSGSPSSEFNILPLSDDKLIIYNNDKVASFNFSSSFSFWQTGSVVNKKGFYKSIFGGAVIDNKNNVMEFFMFPQSASFWSIK
ncbi:MAG: hypothetical protein ABSG94_02535 [Brevinematales bacterium]|jgi:hypothetical protein